MITLITVNTGFVATGVQDMMENRRKALKILSETGLFYILGFLAALGLKYHYSTAGAEDLVWILSPVARLVTLFSGIYFDWEYHTGFVSHTRGVVIAPACAGINFLIICFATIFFTFIAGLNGTREKFSWLGISLATAYLVTLCTNTFRIIISIYLYSAQIYGVWVTPERVHRLAGTLLYVCILVATFLAMERIMRHFNRSVPLVTIIAVHRPVSFPSFARTLPVPFAWYAMITIIAPLLNGAARRNGYRFAEHAALVMVMALFVFLAWFSIAALLKKRVDILNETKEKGEDV